MPICEADPWRKQYFAAVACPKDVYIPTEDEDAYRWHPRFCWVYDKLRIAQSQGLECAPHGVPPQRFPVFSKPIYNLKGMGVGARVLRSAADYELHLTPGHLWMPVLHGDHVSTDVAVEQGRIAWLRHAHGIALAEGTFDYWVIESGSPAPAGRAQLERYLRDWVESQLAGYTGMANIETIGGRIIEVHLRFADQWPDLNGEGWLEAVVGLYSSGAWRRPHTPEREGYSVVLFGPHGPSYRHPPVRLTQRIAASPQITSLQITFHEDRPPASHAMPAGGFRLAVINCFDLDAGRHAREQLAEEFRTQVSAAHPAPAAGRRSRG
ncbi:MAG TPA: hypothetical protein VF315_08070 [Steroidobacteraceae bacterium]